MPKSFYVNLIISGKKGTKDPVADTLRKDLMNKQGYDMVIGARSGKFLRIDLEAKNEEEAKSIVTKMANELRIFNPVIHKMEIIDVGEL
ncbi:MAG: phosphoribosylformylglycinamidine synthase subunit PurS [Candidatus Helarchaeota archaeon]